METVFIIIALFFSVILHEIAHGWVAFLLGDPTARRAGRLTINPFKHIDPLGTIIVPTVLKTLGFMPLGWAKPVPINYMNLRYPKRDMIWVAISGPGTNIGIALLASLLLKAPWPGPFAEFLIIVVLINLLLAFFNLIPIPPLDGSRVMMGILPRKWAGKVATMESWGLIVVFILLNIGLLNRIWDLVLFAASQLGVNIYLLP